MLRALFVISIALGACLLVRAYTRVGDHEPTATPIKEPCSELRERIDRAWGKGSRDVWTNPRHGTRLTLHANAGTCLLVPDSYVPTSEWISTRDSAQVPLALVGQPATSLPLPARIHRNASHFLALGDPSGEQYAWPIAGTGDHVPGGRVIAVVASGIVAELRVELFVARERSHGEWARIREELHSLVEPFRDRLEIARTGFVLVIRPKHHGNAN